MSSGNSVIITTKVYNADGSVTEIKKITRAVDEAGAKTDGFGAKLGKIGTIVTGITAANALEQGWGKITSFMGASVQQATALEQSIGAVETVYGRASGKMVAESEKAAQAIGLSKNAYLELSAVTGAFLQNYGMSADQASGKTVELTERAADLAATFGGSVKDAMNAIQAALRGETDPIERYGVALNAAKIEARALAMTGKEVAASLTDQEKVAARLDLIFAQTAKTQGQFARESDTAANKAERQAASMENMQAKLGEKLLPAQLLWLDAQVKTVDFIVSDVIPRIDNLIERYQALEGAILAAVDAAAKPLGVGLPGGDLLGSAWDNSFGRLGKFGGGVAAGAAGVMLPGIGPLLGAAGNSRLLWDLLGAGSGGADSAAAGGAVTQDSPFAGLGDSLAGLAESEEKATEKTAELRKGIDYLADGLIDMSEASALGLDAMSAGAVEAIESMSRAQDDADRKAFEHSKTLSKLAVMYERNEAAAGRLFKTLASAALDAARAAGAAIFGRPTQESAALELKLANLDVERLGAEARLNPELDQLRRRLEDMGSGVDENVVNLKRQKAEYDAMLSNLRSLGTATAEEIEWARVQSENYQKLINDAEAQGNQERSIVEARIKAIEDEIASYDRRREAIEREIEQYNARQRVMEAELQLADKTLLTADEQRKKFEELLPQMADTSTAFRDISEKLGDDVIPEMDELRDKAGLLADATQVLADDKFRDTLIPAIDSLAEHTRVAALAMDEAATEISESGRRMGDAFSSIFSGIGGAISGGLGTLTDRSGWDARVASIFGGFRARGGPVDAGRAYMVGEDGPELYVPGASGAIIPTGMGGGITINVHVAGSIHSERDLVATIGRAMRSGAFRGMNPAFG